MPTEEPPENSDNNKPEEAIITITANESRLFERLKKNQTELNNKQINYICTLIENSVSESKPESDSKEPKDPKEQEKQLTSKTKEVLCYLAQESVIVSELINPLYELLKKMSEQDDPENKKRKLNQHQFNVTNNDKAHKRYVNIEKNSADPEEGNVLEAMDSFFNNSSELYNN